MSNLRKRESIEGYLFVAPLLVRLIVFTAGPMLASLAISFCKYNLFTAPKFIGIGNYAELSRDPLFWQSLKVTAIYSFVSVPIGLSLGLAAALLMNQKIKGIAIFRTIYYLPAVVSGSGRATSRSNRVRRHDWSVRLLVLLGRYDELRRSTAADTRNDDRQP